MQSRSRLEDAVGFDDVRVCEHLQDFQLFLDVGYAGRVVGLAGLDRADLAVAQTDDFPHDAAATLAQVLEDLELTREALLGLEAFGDDQVHFRSSRRLDQLAVSQASEPVALSLVCLEVCFALVFSRFSIRSFFFLLLEFAFFFFGFEALFSLAQLVV